MNELNTISFKFKEICEKYGKSILDNVSYYHKEITDEINKITNLLELQNQVAALSNSSIADALMDTIKHIAYAKAESNYKTCCMYLEEAIKDLASGMDATEMLWKYDMILYNLQHGDELEKVNMFLKEIHWYEQCDKNKGDKCEHGRCQYSVLSLGQENGFCCGRSHNLKT